MYQNKIREYRKQKGMNLEELARENRNIDGIFMSFREGNKNKSIHSNHGKNSKNIRKKCCRNFF